eukprot:4655123-Amphidinium_carterae.1
MRDVHFPNSNFLRKDVSMSFHRRPRPPTKRSSTNTSIHPIAILPSKKHNRHPLNGCPFSPSCWAANKTVLLHAAGPASVPYTSRSNRSIFTCGSTPVMPPSGTHA